MDRVDVNGPIPEEWSLQSTGVIHRGPVDIPDWLSQI